MTRSDLDALAEACRTRYRELSVLSYAELTQLDWAGEDGHRLIEPAGGLTACVEVSFCRYPDGRLDPDDGGWEADWR